MKKCFWLKESNIKSHRIVVKEYIQICFFKKGILKTTVLKKNNTFFISIPTRV